MNFNLSAFALAILLLIIGGGPSIAFAEDSTRPEPWFSPEAPDQSDWSAKRISRFTEVDYQTLGEPQAVIRIPDLALKAAIYPDSVSLALEAGAAWVTGTTRPGDTGNVVIAGHRDSFFRSLEDIPLGTRIEVGTPDGKLVYVVHHIEIVDPLDVSPLDATVNASLTLITCHPFRYQGFAPDRYIVRALLEEDVRQQAERTDASVQTSVAEFDREKGMTL